MSSSSYTDNTTAGPPPSTIIREGGIADVLDAVRLLESVWSADPGDGPVTAPVLHALLHTGGLLPVARDARGGLLAAAVAFRSTRAPEVLHLHVLGVAAVAQGQGLGTRMMLHLRARAAELGVTRLTWTFDPIVARNAHFYLNVLGAHVEQYVRDPYGALDDAINAGQGSDRLLVTWDVAGSCEASGEPAASSVPSALAESASGGPERLPVTAALVAVEIPADIETLRVNSPGLARAWRSETRAILGATGATVVGLDHRGRYLVRNHG